MLKFQLVLINFRRIMFRKRTKITKYYQYLIDNKKKNDNQNFLTACRKSLCKDYIKV